MEENSHGLICDTTRRIWEDELREAAKNLSQDMQYPDETRTHDLRNKIKKNCWRDVALWISLKITLCFAGFLLGLFLVSEDGC
jgi:hypothetical protein